MKNYVRPRTKELSAELEPVLGGYSGIWPGGDCDECRDEHPFMPPDPEDDYDDFLGYN